MTRVPDVACKIAEGCQEATRRVASGPATESGEIRALQGA